jgi:hypothetical protein
MKTFCKRKIYKCHYAISRHHSNELTSVNTLNECKLRGKSRQSDRCFVPVYCIYSVNTENILMWISEASYTIQRRQFTIDCGCYLWEMPSNIGLDASLNNIFNYVMHRNNLRHFQYNSQPVSH